MTQDRRVPAKIACPYKLPLLPNPQSICTPLNRRALWEALEFFRIEALLRSPAVWKLFRAASKTISKDSRQERPNPKSIHQWISWYCTAPPSLSNREHKWIWPLLWNNNLLKRFAVVDSWAILAGTHHRYLKIDHVLAERLRMPPVEDSPENDARSITKEVEEDSDAIKKSAFRLGDGIIDLAELARLEDFSLSLSDLKVGQARYSYLRIDNIVAPEATITALRKILQDRNKLVQYVVEAPAIDAGTKEQIYPHHPRKDPPIKNVQAWLKYLTCYDLRHQSQLDDSQIDSRVYGNEHEDHVLTVGKAIYRVEKLIDAAEKNAWPPSLQ